MCTSCSDQTPVHHSLGRRTMLGGVAAGGLPSICFVVIPLRFRLVETEVGSDPGDRIPHRHTQNRQTLPLVLEAVRESDQHRSMNGPNNTSQIGFGG